MADDDGLGLKPSDVLTLGLIAGGGYLAWKVFGAIDGVGDAVGKQAADAWRYYSDPAGWAAEKALDARRALGLDAGRFGEGRIATAEERAAVPGFAERQATFAAMRAVPVRPTDPLWTGSPEQIALFNAWRLG